MTNCSTGLATTFYLLSTYATKLTPCGHTASSTLTLKFRTLKDPAEAFPCGAMPPAPSRHCHPTPEQHDTHYLHQPLPENHTSHHNPRTGLKPLVQVPRNVLNRIATTSSKPIRKARPSGSIDGGFTAEEPTSSRACLRPRKCASICEISWEACAFLFHQLVPEICTQDTRDRKDLTRDSVKTEASH